MRVIFTLVYPVSNPTGSDGHPASWPRLVLPERVTIALTELAGAAHEACSP
jgi:hypothetical protein